MSDQEREIVVLLSGVIHLITEPQEDGEELNDWVLREAHRIRLELLSKEQE